MVFLGTHQLITSVNTAVEIGGGGALCSCWQRREGVQGGKGWGEGWKGVYYPVYASCFSMYFTLNAQNVITVALGS
jgi:hypothetical protein